MAAGADISSLRKHVRTGEARDPNTVSVVRFAPAIEWLLSSKKLCAHCGKSASDLCSVELLFHGELDFYSFVAPRSLSLSLSLDIFRSFL